MFKICNLLINGEMFMKYEYIMNFIVDDKYYLMISYININY